MAKEIENNDDFQEWLKNKYKLVNGELCIISKTGNVRICNGNVSNGYLKITITYNGKSYSFKKHRVIFFLHHNYFPKIIDHKNRIKTDNCIENLREVSHSDNILNCYNRQKPMGNCKYLGVSFYKATKKYMSYITINKSKIHLGYFDNKEDAAKIRNQYIIDNNLQDRYKLNFSESNET